MPVRAPARWAVAALLAAAVVLAVGFRVPYQNWGDDWAGYMLQARSLLDGTIPAYLAENGFMMREASFTSGPAAYPWGLPLLLAAEARVFGFDLSVFQAGNIVLYLLLIVTVYGLGRRHLTAGSALALAAVFALHPLLLHYCNHVLTEIPFTLVTMGAFWLADSPRARRPWWPAVLGLAAAAAFLLRTNGLLLLPALTVREWMDPEPGPRGRRLVRLALPYLTFGAVMAALAPLLPAGGESHLAMLGRISGATVLDNLGTYPVALFDFFTAGRGSLVAALLLGPVMVYGAWVTRRATLHLTAYFLLSLALFVLWPAGQSFRFMLPLTPVAALFLLAAVDAVPPCLAAAGMTARAVRVALPAAFGVASLAILATGGVAPQEWHPYDPASREMFAWVRGNTAPEAVIGFFKPRAMHLFAGRRALSAYLADLPKLDYLVAAKRRTIWNPDAPALAEYDGAARLEPLYENRNFRVLRVRP